jgi:hypothetical protein
LSLLQNWPRKNKRSFLLLKKEQDHRFKPTQQFFDEYTSAIRGMGLGSDDVDLCSISLGIMGFAPRNLRTTWFRSCPKSNRFCHHILLHLGHYFFTEKLTLN